MAYVLLWIAPLTIPRLTLLILLAIQYIHYLQYNKITYSTNNGNSYYPDSTIRYFFLLIILTPLLHLWHYAYLYSCIAKNPRYIEGENCEIKSVNDVPLHLEFGLKFRNIWVLRKNLTQINEVFHEKQDKTSLHSWMEVKKAISSVEADFIQFY